MQGLRRYARSSSLALGVLISLLLLVSVLFSVYALVAASNQDLAGETEAAINSELLFVKRFLEHGEPTSLDNFIAGRTGSGYLYALRNVANEITGDFSGWPDAGTEIDDGVISFETPLPAADGQPNAAESQLLMGGITTLESGERLLVARNVDDLFFAQTFAQAFSWITSAVLLVFAVGSIAVGVYVFDRMNRVADTAISIVETGDLSRRLPVDSNWDDLSKMTMVLNRFLDELEEMVRGVKSVSDSIAHDLRTPLARLRSDIEQTLRGEEQSKLLEELDNILAIFNSLLRITEIETEKRKDAFQPVEFGTLITDALELYEPIAEGNGIKIRCEINSAQIQGDRDLLFQLVANLLDNAVKFTPGGGAIEVICKHSGDELFVSVADSGPGIASELRQEVLKRFYRVDNARTVRGNGLGLAMVAAVVKLHEGRLILTDGLPAAGHANEITETERDTGLCCQVVLPI
ncbi:MAG: HAMP domain-containing sensor histidine kinase [Pseudomonadota bacterium]